MNAQKIEAYDVTSTNIAQLIKYKVSSGETPLLLGIMNKHDLSKPSMTTTAIDVRRRTT